MEQSVVTNECRIYIYKKMKLSYYLLKKIMQRFCVYAVSLLETAGLSFWIALSFDVGINENH